MPYDLDVGIASVEVEDIALHCLQLGGSAGVLGGLTILSHTTDIDDVSRDGVIPCSTVGDLPRVYLGILVVTDEALHLAIQVDHVGIADL
jgi:hypothetical protein